jgi:hypothetical protein
MNKDDVFFPMLKRQSSYPKNHHGGFLSNYSKYKQHIRQDCLGRCVYCDSHENENGGAENMNLDHFRPKSLTRFTHLTNNPVNLVWSCGGCNRLKGNHWPDENSDESIIGEVGFIDPFITNYKEYFNIKDDGCFIPKKPPAQYMLGVLALNRPSKQKIRELRLMKLDIVSQISKQIEELRAVLSTVDGESKIKIEGVIQSLSAIQKEIFGMLDFQLR